jgi:hypothetical protein
MKGTWNRQKHLPQQIKNIPEDDDSQKYLKNFRQSTKIGRFYQPGFTEPSQTSGANNAIFVFADAFPTKKSFALWATCRGFT